MKYITEITVALPLEEFVRKLDNPENMKHWQKGLVSYKQLSGTPGREGAKMELNYDIGKRKIVMVETIIKQNLPYEFHATYDTKGVHNIQKNYFKEIDEFNTQWISEAAFEFDSFMMKAMAFLMPSAFKKQSLKYLQDFKVFAEEGSSVASS